MEIFGPNGKKIYTDYSEQRKKLSFLDYLKLGAGSIACFFGVYLLADIAVGILLLMGGWTTMSMVLMRRKK